jgi:adenylate cyclase
MSRKSIAKPSGLIQATEIGTRTATALLGALLSVLVGFLALSKAGSPLVMLSYDMPFIVHRAGGADNVCIVYLSELDRQSLDRRPQARLLDRLSEAGARMVLYDLIFDEPSKDPAIDEEFAAAIRRFRGVDEDGTPIPGASSRQVFLGCARDTQTQTGLVMETLVVPTDTLLNAADDFGIVAFDEDSFIIRKLSTGTLDEPSLTWKAAQAAGAGLDENSRMDSRWINFAGPPPGADSKQDAVPIASFDAGSVLSGGVSLPILMDKIVIIGGRPGIVGQELGRDLFSTPFHRFPVTGKIPYLSGVEVQANAVANLIGGNWLIRSSPRSDTLLILSAGALIGAGLTLLRPIKALLTAAGLTLAAATAGVLTVHYGNQWFPWTAVGFLQIPTALVWAIGSNSYIERFLRIKLNADQQAIRAAFAKYLSPQMLDRLTIDGFHTKLGGEKVQAAMMFTDLEDFTSMCERVAKPEQIVETLNGYFERTTHCIFDHDGVVIKYIGDAIFAAWGAPLPDPQAPLNAARAAWSLFESATLAVDGQELRTRIGLHCGSVVAGNVGSSRRVDYTLIGDAVNLAARLEGINKALGTSILMSDAVKQCLNGEFRTRRVGTFRVKGRNEPVVIHELLGPAREETEPSWIVAYHKGLDALEAGDFPAAVGFFTATSALRGVKGDGPSDFLCAQIKEGQTPKDGIVDLKEK